MDLATFSLKRALISSWLLLLLCTAMMRAQQECNLLMQRGRDAYQSREFPLAITEFQQALKICGQRSDIALALGEAQLLAGHVPDSIQTLTNAASLDPKNAMAHKVLGDALYLGGKEIEAEQSLKTALALNAGFEPALYALGRIYYQQNRFPEAVKQFQRVIDLNPANHRAHDNLALCYDALSRDSEALLHFKTALDLVHTDHPEYDWAYANFADFFLKRNQYEKAFQLAAEAAQRNPKSARNFFLTGKALVALGKDQLSLRWLQHAVELDPNYQEAHYLLARTYRKLGRQQDAEREFSMFSQLKKKPVSRR
jgi:tetratricopeptide (TPR) repeat protein